MSKKILALLAASALIFSGCGGSASGNVPAENKEAVVAGDEAIEEKVDAMDNENIKTGAVFDVVAEDIHVSLSTDKTDYAEGEEVSFSLLLEDQRMLWNVSEAELSYTADAGLGLLKETDLPEKLESIVYGDSETVSGVLVKDGNVLPKKTGAVNLKSYTGDKKLTIRPYVQFNYGGEEATLRIVIDMNLRQQPLEFKTEDKAYAKRTSCHDPGIFKDKDGTYYIFGTHIAMSKSSDLTNWTNLDDKFRQSFTEEAKTSIRAWNRDSGNWYGYLWAPDVIWNDSMQKYCMYLSANGDDWVSNIVLLTADNAEGPYDYAGSVVYGGFTADTFNNTDAPKVLDTEEIPERYITNGIENKKWGDKFPNCIDPCVFFDDNGGLWMTYGSWSGGIFELALDPETGLRDYSVSYDTDEHSDAYFGKKLAGGWYVSGEASFVQKIEDFYYLFVTYGGLEAKGGYNMRVFRSENPDGPFVDELGKSALYDQWVQNFNQSIGVRLFGAYKWRNFSTGQVAQGHNSAFVDDDGRAFLIYHTRTSDGTEGHFVRVHQLFVNENGWLVAAPYHTNGEKLDSSITAEDIAGIYEVMLHRMDIDYENYDVVVSDTMELHEDGTVSGAYGGTWSYDPEYCYIKLDLTGSYEDLYSGVALRMKIEDTNVETMVFTALGEKSQLTLWGSKLVE